MRCRHTFVCPASSLYFCLSRVVSSCVIVVLFSLSVQCTFVCPRHRCTFVCLEYFLSSSYFLSVLRRHVVSRLFCLYRPPSRVVVLSVSSRRRTFVRLESSSYFCPYFRSSRIVGVLWFVSCRWCTRDIYLCPSRVVLLSVLRCRHTLVRLASLLYFCPYFGLSRGVLHVSCSFTSLINECELLRTAPLKSHQ
ncbi:hypothetical protein JOB18_008225 [Solea senegalensis]|uniref:Uncharacterized protein n=1 Tax=Solea senegalensis TaxID=28829 RepID=A0AAV6S808_SOLSE|nr:hypothetical protein JOB18_008225 [Solea senegalensis]